MPVDEWAVVMIKLPLSYIEGECPYADMVYIGLKSVNFIGIISKERTGGGLNKRAIFFAPLFSTLSVFPN